MQAAKIAGHAAGQGLGYERLADSRHIFQEHVLAGEQRDQAPADDLGLAEHHAAHVLFKLRNELIELLAGQRFEFFCGGSVKIHGAARSYDPGPQG